MSARGAVDHLSDEDKKQVTVFQHPEVPFLKISINSSSRAPRVSPTSSDERERGGERLERPTCRTSMRRPTPTAPPGGRPLSLAPPREAKARSLSPARNRPELPTGRQAAREESQAPKPKRSFIDTGAAKLFEKAADLKSSLDSPQYRLPREDYQESISLPSSPMNSRKIGLSYMTPPTSRKLGSSVSPGTPAKHQETDKGKPPKLAQNLIRTESRSSAPIQPIPTPFTFHLLGPERSGSQPSSRSSSPGPFTSVLKSTNGSRSGSTGAAEGSVAQRVSRLDTGSRKDQLVPGGPSAAEVKRRGVSPTPLGNLRLATSKPAGDNSGKKWLAVATGRQLC